mmetsp:Transcript_14501/g.36224  ORF Transcript_14501/g.36224 Transcript_14501/m.36224 type:complete len:206 (+) Transcript_14501:64-681(+)
MRSHRTRPCMISSLVGKRPTQGVVERSLAPAEPRRPCRRFCVHSPTCKRMSSARVAYLMCPAHFVCTRWRVSRVAASMAPGVSAAVKIGARAEQADPHEAFMWPSPLISMHSRCDGLHCGSERLACIQANLLSARWRIITSTPFTTSAPCGHRLRRSAPHGQNMHAPSRHVFASANGSFCLDITTDPVSSASLVRTSPIVSQPRE